MEFIADLDVVGHNVIGFDLKFLKIQPRKTEDTLVMCRSKWKKGNNLENACKRLGIEFDSDKAHGAQYDVEKTAELYIALKEEGEISQTAMKL